jgi:hypothetical protein
MSQSRDYSLRRVAMKYPKPMPGNPREFTIDQHVFPAESLSRFAAEDGFVKVRRVGQAREFRLKPTDEMFCAKRAWDERTEKHLMKQIEDRFQQLAEAILRGHRSLSTADYKAASQFYALCRVRGEHRSSPTRDCPTPGVTGDDLTPDQQENLEKNGYIYVLKSGVPGRMMAGVFIQRHIDYFVHQLRGTPWGVITSSQGEFVVPDAFGTYPIVPVSPTLCLVAGTTERILDSADVKDLNIKLMSAVKHYVVARNFDECPL